ncbi:MAG: GtrA family protein [Hyphomicrobiaceae bacterium]
MSDEQLKPTVQAQGQSAARHWGGFLISGLLAFSVDAIVLEAGVRLMGLNPLLARLIAISLAMVVGWLAHRRLTFAVEVPASIPELARYVAAGWSAAAVNYLVFAGLLLAVPHLPRLACLVVASGIAMVFAYVAMRYAVFKASGKVVG